MAVKFYLQSKIGEGIHCIESLLPDMTEEAFRRLQEISDPDFDEELDEDEEELMLLLEEQARNDQQLEWEVVRHDDLDDIRLLDEDFDN